MQIVVLEKKKENWEARELGEHELRDHQEAIDYAENHMRKAFDERPEAPAPPDAPQQPSRDKTISANTPQSLQTRWASAPLLQSRSHERSASPCHRLGRFPEQAALTEKGANKS